MLVNLNIQSGQPFYLRRHAILFERQTGFCIQDEVEIPVFDNQSDFVCLPRRASTCSSDEEIVSDDEVKENNMLLIKSISSGAEYPQKVSFPGSGIIRKDEECAWSAATREVDALVHLNENAACSSSHAVFPKVNRSCKGGRGKTKPKFSFNFQSHKEDLPWAVHNKEETDMSSKAIPMLEEFESVERRTVEHSMSELLEFFHGGKIEQSEIHAVQAEATVRQDYTKHSMAELLDCFQENNGLNLTQGNSKVYGKTKGRRAQLVVKRSISPLGDRNMDDDDLPVALDSESSSGDEVSLH